MSVLFTALLLAIVAASGAWLQADVHRAGRLAYAVELIVSTACYIFALVAAGVP